MLNNFIRMALGTAALFLASGAPVNAQQQEPPDEAGRGVARISVLDGDVSVRRADSGDNVAANINAPLESSDEIATGANARAEVQFDSANRLRLGHDAEARVADLENGRVHVEVSHGTVTFSVLRNSTSQVEISTPVVSIRPMEPGAYRLNVKDDGQTTLTVRSGEADVYSPSGSERVKAGQTMLIRGDAQNAEFQIVASQTQDEWDGWNEQRDSGLQRNESDAYRYVDRDIAGAEDLNGNGRWVYDASYGNVWTPNVGSDWAPYRAGRWSWLDYYGWTWVSDDPWGWAPYHYGNWYQNSSIGWCWYPGRAFEHHFWRPALVAFFGFGGGWGNVGWVPLAPYERFHPWYGRGVYGGYRGGFGNNINIVNNTNIINLYRNASAPGAVSGVAANAFTNGQFRNIGRVNPDQIRQASLTRGQLPLVPTNNNLRFNDRQTSVAARSFSNTPYASRAPIQQTGRVPFQQQRMALEQGGRQFGTGGTVAQNQQNSQWGRFGSPTTRPAPSASFQSGGTRPQPNSSWSRFGTPTSRSLQGGSQADAQNLRIAPSIVHNRANDRPSTVNRPSYSQPNYSQPAYNRPSYSQPPATRQPAYSRPSYSQPIYSQPSRQPSYSQPSYSRQGDSQPSYSQPSRQPSYSQPSYSRPSNSQPTPSRSSGNNADPRSSSGGNSGSNHHGR